MIMIITIILVFLCILFCYFIILFFSYNNQQSQYKHKFKCNYNDDTNSNTNGIVTSSINNDNTTSSNNDNRHTNNSNDYHSNNIIAIILVIALKRMLILRLSSYCWYHCYYQCYWLLSFHHSSFANHRPVQHGFCAIRRHQTCDFCERATSAPAELGGEIHSVSRNRAHTQVLCRHGSCMFTFTDVARLVPSGAMRYCTTLHHNMPPVSPFLRALAMRSRGRNCSPAPDLVL